MANNGLINQKSEDDAVNSRLNERLDVIRQMKPNGGLLPGDAPITPAERAEAALRGVQCGAENRPP